MNKKARKGLKQMYSLLDITREIDGKGDKTTKQKVYRIAQKLTENGSISPVFEGKKAFYSADDKAIIIDNYRNLSSSKREQIQSEQDRQKSTAERAELEKQIEILQELNTALKSQIESLQGQLNDKQKTIEMLDENLKAEQSINYNQSRIITNLTKPKTLKDRIKGLFISDKHIEPSEITNIAK